MRCAISEATDSGTPAALRAHHVVDAAAVVLELRFDVPLLGDVTADAVAADDLAAFIHQRPAHHLQRATATRAGQALLEMQRAPAVEHTAVMAGEQRGVGGLEQLVVAA